MREAWADFEFTNQTPSFLLQLNSRIPHFSDPAFIIVVHLFIVRKQHCRPCDSQPHKQLKPSRVETRIISVHNQHKIYAFVMRASVYVLSYLFKLNNLFKFRN